MSKILTVKRITVSKPDIDETESTHCITDVGYISDASEPPLQIPLDIAVNGALDRMEISSDMSWTAFCLAISSKLNVPASQLDLAWKLSTETKNDLPRHLSSAAHLLQLISTATQHLEGKIKSRSKKEFAVQIINKSSPAADTAKPPNGSHGSKAKVCFHTCWMNHTDLGCSRQTRKMLKQSLPLKRCRRR